MGSRPQPLDPYDDRLNYERGPGDVSEVAEQCRALGSKMQVLESELAEAKTPAQLVDASAARGDLRGLVISHAESVDRAAACHWSHLTGTGLGSGGRLAT